MGVMRNHISTSAELSDRMDQDRPFMLGLEQMCLEKSPRGYMGTTVSHDITIIRELGVFFHFKYETNKLK